MQKKGQRSIQKGVKKKQKNIELHGSMYNSMLFQKKLAALHSSSEDIDVIYSAIVLMGSG